MPIREKYQPALSACALIAVATAVFLFQISLLGSDHGLFVLLTIVVAAVCALASLFRVLSAGGFTLFTLSVLYIALSTGPCADLRADLTDRINTWRFFRHYDAYRKEVAALAQPAYREWRIGNQDLTQYTVVHDTTWKFKRMLYKDGGCSSRYTNPVQDYYIVTVSC